MRTFPRQSNHIPTLALRSTALFLLLVISHILKYFLQFVFEFHYPFRSSSLKKIKSERLTMNS